MAQEIELKLSLPQQAQAALLRQPLLASATAKRSQQLSNLYYDTPKLTLRRRGIALRLRKQGRVWLQTVKCAGDSAAGLSSRPEWETPYAGRFDFSAVDDPRVRRQLERPALATRLQPLFETRFRRTTWRFEPTPGCVFHLMLDRGWVIAAGRREPISEVEIELESGEVEQIFTLALALAERLPLLPQVLSKAERGYRLYQNLPPAPAKALPLPLDAKAAPLVAFRQIALSCLEQQGRNLEGAQRGDDPEFIHQARVATRRLRAAVRLFGPLLPGGLADELLPPLRQLMDKLGQARDLDVLLADIALPVQRSLPKEPRLALLVDAVAQRQRAARQEARRQLAAPAYGRLMLLAIVALHRPPLFAAPAGTSILAFAAARLQRLRKKVLALAAVARQDDPAALHRLRIAVKRLRYALEFLSTLCAAKAVDQLLLRLGALQEELGQLNDLANAGPLLERCAGDEPRLREAVSLVGGWHAARHRQLLARIAERLRQLRRLRLPILL